MKKGQVWFLDFMVGLFIFLSIVAYYYNFYNNIQDDAEAEWNEMLVDSKAISSSLMSEGYPTDWNATNVQRIGLLDGTRRLNEEKIDQFISMEYNLTQNIFSTRFNYYFFIESSGGDKIKEAGAALFNQTFVVQTTRIVVYNSSMCRMVIYVWK